MVGGFASFGSQSGGIGNWLSSAVSLLTANAGKLAALALVVFLLTRLLPKPDRTRSELVEKMEKTFKRTGLYIEEKKRGQSEKLLPELKSLDKDGPFLVFRYQLIPGLSVQQCIERKPFFDAAFDSDTFISGSGSQLTIKIETGKRQRLSI